MAILFFNSPLLLPKHESRLMIVSLGCNGKDLCPWRPLPHQVILVIEHLRDWVCQNREVGVVLRKYSGSLAEGSDQPYEVPEERMVLVLRQEHLQRPSVMNRDVQVSAFADDPAQLQKPRICQVMTIA
jgi:hypothetical protein